MRARNLKPGFFENEELAQLSFEARLLFAGLWCYADREGRFEWRPQRIKALLFPYDDVVITSLLMSLHSMTLILQYKDSNGTYGCIPTFKKHQNPHPHEAASVLPDPQNCEMVICEQNQCHAMSGGYCNADSLIPSSLNPEPKNSSSVVFAPESDQMKLAILLRDLINSHSPNGKPLITERTKMQTWAKQMDYITRLDNRPTKEVEALIRWVQKDSFWHKNILSPGKLREKYPQLILKMQDDTNKGQTWADRRKAGLK